MLRTSGEWTPNLRLLAWRRYPPTQLQMFSRAYQLQTFVHIVLSVDKRLLIGKDWDLPAIHTESDERQVSPRADVRRFPTGRRSATGDGPEADSPVWDRTRVTRRPPGVGETGFEPATSAPKADALPRCATPRRRFLAPRADRGQLESGRHGSDQRRAGLAFFAGFRFAAGRPFTARSPTRVRRSSNIRRSGSGRPYTASSGHSARARPRRNVRLRHGVRRPSPDIRSN